MIVYFRARQVWIILIDKQIFGLGVLHSLVRHIKKRWLNILDLGQKLLTRSISYNNFKNIWDDIAMEKGF